ncbi:hypothetical protein [Roseateles saccharophilus]|uniref:DUF3108 domain-containing protein n=1 Tax=Roseateles saccharophilus TaxID=304 RepID=A0A4R3V4Z3_ROSSA|nr:hypothetical protein [Roseateles saccharophilus]MDG0831950.1 hypothetical protein [Roseateles saccharophilus]TCU97384.1 hypothetical protein EV671_101159 [Roseateles saccharophilus]
MRAALPSPRAAALALAASLLAHAALLGGERAREDASARPARAVSIALLPPPAPPVALPEAAAAPPPAARPRTTQPGERPPPPAIADAPLAEPDAPLLRLAGPATWRYRLRQAGQDGEALLDWRPEADGRYSLRLTRQVGERALPAWASLGRTGGAGLAPERFALQRGGQDRQAVNFDAEGRRVSFSASPAQFELPEGAQDRLSWWLQLAALVQAAPAPGGRWRVWVASPRGELREWVFDAVDAEPDDAGTLHLRRQTLGPHDPGIELWLDPARGYWPVRLRQGDPETRGFEIGLLEAAR